MVVALGCIEVAEVYNTHTFGGVDQEGVNHISMRWLGDKFKEGEYMLAQLQSNRKDPKGLSQSIFIRSFL